ncbi:MAG: type II secretion system protein [Calditrichaeota bacterium]|nr:type II secretion system protein [Calditrichota bacterium]MCB9368531.1 type II secretion system protein [Calditrichota bacterium]
MNMKRIARKWQAGVTLLEVLVTTLIVTGGLVVVMASFVGIAKSNRYVEKMETANNLLRLELETVRNSQYSNIVSVSSDYGDSYSDQPDFRRYVSVADLGTVKRITVKIYFDHDLHFAEATTMVAQL